MPHEFWVRSANKVRGPFAAADLQRLARDGQLQPTDEVSRDQSRWKPAGEIRGLGLQQTAKQQPSTPLRQRNPLLIAAGTVLLVGLTVATCGAVVSAGFFQTFVVLLLFLATVGLGYAASNMGWMTAGLYAVLVAGFGAFVLAEKFPSDTASLAAGIVVASIVVLAWRLIAMGLGHDYQDAIITQHDLDYFTTKPISPREFRRVQQALGGSRPEASSSRVRLRLDPDDLLRTEDTFVESFEKETKRSLPALGMSAVAHVLLLAMLWLFKVSFLDQNDIVINGGWITEREQTEVIEAPKETAAVELRGLDFNADSNTTPTRNPLRAMREDDEPTDGPASLANVKELLSTRTPEKRRVALSEFEGAERIDEAVSSGLKWLLRHQQPEGHWQLHAGYPNASEVVLRTDTGATALALLAFLGHGQTHVNADDEATREGIERGLNWLLDVQKPNGDFHDWDELGRQTAYYAHSQALIAICEAYAMTGDRKFIEPAERGIRFLLDSQQPIEGGWKYQPQDDQSVGDLSVTGWALMALHTARVANLRVPGEPFRRGMKFLDLVQLEDGARYKYEPRPGWDATHAMTGAGLLCRQYFGWTQQEPALNSGVDYLLSPPNEPVWAKGKRNVYSWYYTGQVLHNLNDERFQRWYQQTATEILDHQFTGGGRSTRGSWSPIPAGDPYEYGEKAGRLYITVMCLLILETPYRHTSLEQPTS
ncbi:GYF domain-containing protein [Thalassoroseus pseudoceratinae]|uniref:GYF domain-containing protein n=1 Tax=Thalassoroseus pseudoceratinae TaxID=2713176 RepID=UPI00141F8CAA|nr:GYF domain-containing protein [Thalassoroseus pseudoceratinae]